MLPTFDVHFTRFAHGHIHVYGDGTHVHYYFVRMSVYTGVLCSIRFLKSVSINTASSWRHLSTLALDSKLILLSLDCIFLRSNALTICSIVFACYFVLILLFSVRIFRNLLVAHACFLDVRLWNWLSLIGIILR